jgi:patatin-like phospholipase/acyl hydrolase
MNFKIASFENKGTIYILSLDGGGIKGLYTSRVLQHFEELYSVKIADCFDLICGTSTGGLITLALASGHTAKSIGDFYESRGKQIFLTRILLSVNCIITNP